MAEMTDDELNRKCAERLGWTLRNYNEDEREACCSADYVDAAINDGWHWDGDPLQREAWQIDFLRDPAANEMLMEAMPNPTLSRDKGVWICEPDFRLFHGERTSDDRKRAIVLAFLAS